MPNRLLVRKQNALLHCSFGPPEVVGVFRRGVRVCSSSRLQWTCEREIPESGNVGHSRREMQVTGELCSRTSNCIIVLCSFGSDWVLTGEKLFLRSETLVNFKMRSYVTLLSTD